VGDVVEPVEDRLGALDPRKRLLRQRSKLDVHELAGAEIREGDAVHLGPERRDVIANHPDAVAPDGGRRDAAPGEPSQQCRRGLPWCGGWLDRSHRPAPMRSMILSLIHDTAPMAVMTKPDGSITVDGQAQAGIALLPSCVGTFRADELLIAVGVASGS